MSHEARLARSLELAGIDHDGAVLDHLAGWLALHQRWSRRINLTGPADVDELIDRHIVDCAMVQRFLPPGTLADVGSGAGLPGLVLAMLDPGRSWYLIEPLERRCAFLEQVVMTLALGNVTIVPRRCEDWAAPELGAVLARAVAPLPRLLAMTANLLGPGTPLLAMKGPGWRQEAAALPSGFTVTRCEHYVVPGRQHEHVLLWVEAQQKEGG